MQQSLLNVIENLPPELQSKVYEYALSLSNEPEASELVLDMHKGAFEIAEDFGAELPESFWLGE